jgi:hypothetical protein
MNLQNGHLSESMTQGSKEMMAGKWQSMLAGLDVREALGHSYWSISYSFQQFDE